ncbi:MAG TPA: hypothetical protein VFR90_17625 [Methylibium sp.]|uniref:hypothetical protein n=1 Tax=Methylibium sp. TaxID=2067992 RepID=UPI002DB75E0B|nr:hypothetical protein [Methylibium sp.]HEU4460945.1 hypothetical protein [Methylibium sp.]
MPIDLGSTRLDNALALFDEFVLATVKHPDAATLRGLEGRFAEKLGIQPSYWSQIKSRSRQIGERLARQFERQCRKPAGWLDMPPKQRGRTTAPMGDARALTDPTPAEPEDPTHPKDDDERFIVGLVLTYYRRHPQRARARLLDLLGEVLVVDPAPRKDSPAPTKTQPTSAVPPDNDHALWTRSNAGVAPLKRKR